MMVRVVVPAFILLMLPAACPAQALSVCQVLDHLSELAGKEVRVRGAWTSGETGEGIWPSPPCDHPTVRDGWIWKASIDVAPVAPMRFREIYRQRGRL
jgi:hypothetical protein